MKYDHDQKGVMDAIGIDARDLFNIMKEIGSIIEGGSSKTSHCLEQLEKETSNLKGQAKAKRMRVLHYLAYSHCESLAEKHMKDLAREMMIKIVSEESVH